MKKLYFILLSLSICNLLYATEQYQEHPTKGTFSVSNDTIKWDCPQILPLEDGVIFVDIKKDETIFLKAITSGLDRNAINQLLKTDKSIFFQDLSTGNYHTEPKYLVNSTPGSQETLKCARVVISEIDLPITIIYNGKTITLENYNDKDKNYTPKKNLQLQLCEITKEYLKSTTDTISLDSLPNYKFFLPDMTVSNGWKAEPEYKINGNSVTVETDKDKKKYIQFSDDICKNVANGTSLIITSHVTIYKEDEKQAKQYFKHTIDGNVLELIISKSNSLDEDPWWKQSIPYGRIIIIVLGVIIIILGLIIINIIRKNKRGSNTQSDETEKISEYIQGIINDKASDKKKDLINRLLENEDENFKNQIVSNPNDKLLEELRDANGILTREKGELEGQIRQLKNDKGELESKIQDLTQSCNTLELENKKLRMQNDRLQKENENLQNQVDRQAKTIIELRSEVAGLKTMIVDKDKQIDQLFAKIKSLKDQLARISRQNMYLLQIDDTLKEVSGGILNAFSEVEDGELKKKLVIPILKGVAGLDEGVTAYYSRWQNQVMLKQKEFFGKDLYEMSDEEVKMKLVSGFLKTLAQGDTFSKLTRLYMYIQADWINNILIENKFNVDEIERIFNRLKLLFNDFGIEIIYPRLFVDHMNEQKYTFDPRGEVFKLFPISEEMRVLYSKQTDLIVDVIQIGIRIPSEQYNRNAIVSIPNF